MSRAVRVYSPIDHSGYGQSAVAYVRGLVNAGVTVHWTQLEHAGSSSPLGFNARAKLVGEAATSEARKDLAALIKATEQPVPYDVVLAQTTPEAWTNFFEPGKRNIGYTTWEADRLPTHWPPLLRQANALCVPCRHNLSVFSGELPSTPVHVIPHVRRHAWHEVSSETKSEFRSSQGIPKDHFVFYSINTWEPRKNLITLLSAFCTAFQADDKVSLIVKTSPTGYGPPPFYLQKDTLSLASEVMSALAEALDRPLPNVCLLPFDVTDDGIDVLHQLGDCYVSMSHGEGWGMGAFDAASLGNPVIMTQWGGPLDFLGEDWSGAIPAKLGQVPIWPPSQPSYWSFQRWAYPDFDIAVQRLRRVVNGRENTEGETQAIQQDIANRFSEHVVTRQLREVLGV